MEFFFQMVVNALQLGSFYALIALGYSMVYGVLLLFNFAHGDVFMVGAYIGLFIATGLLALLTLTSVVLPGWLVLVLTILAAMFVTSFVGITIERIGYRPLRNAPRASAAITGLMIGIILETGNLALLGAERYKFPTLIETATYQIGTVSITNKKVMIVVVAILLMLALHQFVQRTKWGMAMRATAYDFVVVPLMGVSLNRYCRADLCTWRWFSRRSWHPLLHCLPGDGSLHGDHIRMEGFRGSNSGRQRLDPGGCSRRFHAGFH